MAMWYWSVAILFWQLSIDHIVNGQYKRCGFAKTCLRHPSLPFDSLPYPTRTICRRVRSVSHVTTKRKEVDHILWVRGSVPRALRARGSPAIICGIVYRQHNSAERFLEYFEQTLEKFTSARKMFASWVTSIFVFWKVRYRNLVTTFYYLFRAVISFLPLTNLREFAATRLL